MVPMPRTCERQNPIWRTTASLAVALILCAGLLSDETPPKLAASAVQQVAALRSIKTAKTAAQNKIDSRLYLGLLHQRNDARLVALPNFRFVRPEADGRVPAEIVVTSAAGVKAVVNKLGELGDLAQHISYAYRRVSARVHLGNLEVLAAMPEVRKVRQHIPAMTHAINTS